MASALQLSEDDLIKNLVVRTKPLHGGCWKFEGNGVEGEQGNWVQGDIIVAKTSCQHRDVNPSSFTHAKRNVWGHMPRNHKPESELAYVVSGNCIKNCNEPHMDGEKFFKVLCMLVDPCTSKSFRTSPWHSKSWWLTPLNGIHRHRTHYRR